MEHLGVEDRLRSAKRVRVDALASTGVAQVAGVYCWWHDRQPLFIAATPDLHFQLTQLDTKAGNRPVPSFRQFVRGRLQLLGQLPRGADRRQRVAAIDGFIASCEVCWIVTGSLDQAHRLAQQAKSNLIEADGWHTRPGEDRWLRRYLDRLAEPGRTYVEVPLGGISGGKTRRIDAVRISRLSGGVRYYDQAAFAEDVRTHPVDIIEVKRTLNRTVIGQLIVARELAAEEWNRDVTQPLGLVALVTQTDKALERVCKRHGIRIEVVERYPADVDPEP